MADSKAQAAEAVANSIRTGERMASKYAEPHLADDVVLDNGREQVSGKAAVLERISGVWPSTPIYYQGGWTEPTADGDTMKVTGNFPDLGAAPKAMNLTFSYNGQGKINKHSAGACRRRSAAAGRRDPGAHPRSDRRRPGQRHADYRHLRRRRWPATVVAAWQHDRLLANSAGDLAAQR